MASKFILPALALVGTAIAQCDGPSITITTSADAEQIASCSTYDGDVIISSEASGTISINGVGAITGDLQCINATQLTSISADQLATIGGKFNLQELQILSNLAFSSLNGVNTVNWIALPGLQALNFGQGISRANTVYISNTGLTDLKGIELTAVGEMDINNNQYLKTINVNNLANVTQSLSFAANGLDLSIEFPNLESAANLTFRNVTSISMPSLSEVAGFIGLYSNYFESFSAPNLTSTGNTIAVIDSSELSNLSFPMLQTIGGGLQLANNSKLLNIDGFNALQTIDGDINYYGTFDTVSFGSIEDVKGAANIYTSSGNGTICDLFNKAKTAQVIKGKVNCDANSQSPETGGNGSSSSSSSSKNAASSSYVGVSAAITGLVAFAAGMLFI